VRKKELNSIGIRYLGGILMVWGALINGRKVCEKLCRFGGGSGCWVGILNQELCPPQRTHRKIKTGGVVEGRATPKSLKGRRGSRKLQSDSSESRVLKGSFLRCALSRFN